MTVFCIIPARGGSKSIPGKNIIPFRGKALIEHSIAYARAARQVNRVFVSTDDDRIAQIAAAAGADIISRPAEIAGDTATTESAISHALGIWKDQDLAPDIIVLLQATSPLRPAGSLDQALDHLKQEGFDSLLSISPTHRFFWRVKGKEALAEYDFLNRPRRQDMTEQDKRYVENGSVYIFTRDHFEKTGNRLGGKIGYTIFPEDYSLEIDTPGDIILLENIAAKLEG